MAVYFVAFLVLVLPALLGLGQVLALAINVLRAVPALVAGVRQRQHRGGVR